MKYQRGFGALEVMICLIIGALATVAGARVYTSYLDRQVNRSAGEQMGIVADAAAKYIKDNYAAITAVATPAAPAVITTAMLRATGYLPAGFSDTNVYGQDYRILALEPTANKLQTLIVTVNGDVIREMHLLEISKLMGAKGGYISSTNTAVAFGSFGGWQTALAPYGVAPGAGHLATALFFDDGAMVTDYLYRSAVPGQPQLNRMNTSIDMGNNDLNNTDAVNANTVNANTANVSGNTSTAGETYTGGWFRGRGDGLIYNEKWNGGWYMADPQWMRSYADKGIYTGGAMLGGTLQSTGRTTVGEYLHVAGVATAGVGCAPNGLEARDSTGLPLYCQSG
ncbi:shufflon system plasmid conjugative transfer pilus tip adhesin PilV, partial [Metapseudomonas furukawaii]